MFIQKNEKALANVTDTWNKKKFKDDSNERFT